LPASPAPPGYRRIWRLPEYDSLFDDISGWQVRIGPVRLSGRFNSMRFARYFVGFHVTVRLA
jgi:hypothetical protein